MTVNETVTTVGGVHRPLVQIAQILQERHGAVRVVIKLEFEDGQTLSVPSK